jgi:hypothetical protein
VAVTEAQSLYMAAMVLPLIPPIIDILVIMVNITTGLVARHHLDTFRLRARLLFPRVVADTSAMGRIFGESDLDCTMVRPPQLRDKPYAGKYRVREGHLPLSLELHTYVRSLQYPGLRRP